MSAASMPTSMPTPMPAGPAKNVLITGGASGLGLGCAQRFAALGATVTIADINASAGQSALDKLRNRGAKNPSFETLDLANPHSIATLGERMAARGQPLDVLVNNAGIYPPSNLTLSREGHELTFAIAHLGHFRLTHALYPLLKAGPAARIVSISSLVQKQASMNLDDLVFAQGYMPIKAYQQAKLSCLIFARELQKRLSNANSPIQSYAAHPGVVRSSLGRNRTVSSKDNAWQRLMTRMLAVGLGNFGQSPENGASSIIIAATTDRFPPGSFVGPHGLFDAMGKPGLVPPGPVASDGHFGTQFWEKTESITGINWTF